MTAYTYKVHCIQYTFYHHKIIHARENFWCAFAWLWFTVGYNNVAEDSTYFIDMYCFFHVDNTENHTKLIEFIIHHRRKIINNYILVSSQFPHWHIIYHSVTHRYFEIQIFIKKLHYFKNIFLLAPVISIRRYYSH